MNTLLHTILPWLTNSDKSRQWIVLIVLVQDTVVMAVSDGIGSSSGRKASLIGLYSALCTTSSGLVPYALTLYFYGLMQSAWIEDCT